MDQREFKGLRQERDRLLGDCLSDVREIDLKSAEYTGKRYVWDLRLSQT